MLDERVGKPIQHENCVGRVRKSWKKSLIGIKLSSNTKFPRPTRFSIFSQILGSAKPIQHFIQHGKNAILDEMLDWFASALSDTSTAKDLFPDSCFLTLYILITIIHLNFTLASPQCF